MDGIRLIDRWSVIGVELEFTDINDRIHVNKFIIPDKLRGHGISELVISDLYDYAKSLNKRLTLIPSDVYGTKLKTLKMIYRKLGFVDKEWYFEYERC